MAPQLKMNPKAFNGASMADSSLLFALCALLIGEG